MIEVLAENWSAVAVYERCQPAIAAGAGGAIFLGISGMEIESVCRSLRVRTTRRLIDKVQFLANAVWARRSKSK